MHGTTVKTVKISKNCALVGYYKNVSAC